MVREGMRGTRLFAEIRREHPIAQTSAYPRRGPFLEGARKRSLRGSESSKEALRRAMGQLQGRIAKPVVATERWWITARYRFRCFRENLKKCLQKNSVSRRRRPRHPERESGG
jgi:hypothetical protein